MKETSHHHLVVTPGTGFFCLLCGQPLTGTQASDALVSEQSGAFLEAVALSFEQLEQHTSFSINDEYCWMHHGSDLGGWTCEHPDCRVCDQVGNSHAQSL